jgi:hypothetical protein
VGAVKARAEMAAGATAVIGTAIANVRRKPLRGADAKSKQAPLAASSAASVTADGVANVANAASGANNGAASISAMKVNAAKAAVSAATSTAKVSSRASRNRANALRVMKTACALRVVTNSTHGRRANSSSTPRQQPVWKEAPHPRVSPVKRERGEVAGGVAADAIGTSVMRPVQMLNRLRFRMCRAL